ncbi:GNAT family N-acetyltransferase [Paenibacillus puerhi]|uniref:GNAT family N-acetyltransferase n=1 Tax=Paenibacillus puerhi TaxID=2692622 RepID=UPI001357DF4E|nr:GNAT family N-acetyltransferase [Paenibacillus puerhi]
MDVTAGDVLISNDKSLLCMETICSFLARSYWADKRSESRIRKSIENSVCYGAYHGGKQIGFARLVTDGATMYWLCDVFIDENYRSYGIGKKLIETITTSEDFKDLLGVLGTKDAHGLYEQYGFHQEQERFMRRMPDFLRSK